MKQCGRREKKLSPFRPSFSPSAALFFFFSGPWFASRLHASSIISPKVLLTVMGGVAALRDDGTSAP